VIVSGLIAWARASAECWCWRLQVHVKAEATPGAISEEPAAPAPVRREGLQVAPWLRLGSLRDFSSKAAEHALLPALRRRWRFARQQTLPSPRTTILIEAQLKAPVQSTAANVAENRACMLF